MTKKFTILTILALISALAFVNTYAVQQEDETTPTPADCAAGNEIFSDDFSDPTSGWRIDQGSGFDWAYQSGEYRVFITEPEFTAWAWAPISSSNIPKDFCLELDLKLLVQGSLSEIGEVSVILAGNPDGRRFISFGLFPNGDGFYRVRDIDFGQQEFSTFVDWTQSDFIDPVNSFNTILVISKNGETSFYINDNLVETLNLNLSGSVGVYTHTFDEPNVNGRFDNFKVTGL